MRRRREFLALLFFFLFFCATVVFAAQGKGTKIYPRESELCKESFDIDEIEIKDGRFIKNISFLADYFQCRAAAKNDISECEQLAPWNDRIASCKRYFLDMYGFFGKIFSEGFVSDSAVSICVKCFRLKKQECETFGEACLKNDKSFCRTFQDSKRKKECEAYVAMDEVLCGSDSSCRNRVIFIKALKNKDIRMCSRLKDSMAKQMCRGYVSGQESVCRECEGYKKFRDFYCECRKSMSLQEQPQQSRQINKIKTESEGGHFEEVK